MPLFSSLKKLLFALFALLNLMEIAGCNAIQPLYVEREKFPDSIGVKMINSAYISDEDWRVYEDETIIFIRNFNSENTNQYKLYFTKQDSNCIRLDFTRNAYVTRTKQIVSIAIGAACLGTTIALLSNNPNSPRFVWFPYVPKNRLVIYSSISSDLNGTGGNSKFRFISRHNFESLATQKSKQFVGFYTIIQTIFKNLELNTNKGLYHAGLYSPDLIQLKNYESIRGKIITTESDFIEVKYVKYDKIVVEKINISQIRTIKRNAYY